MSQAAALVVDEVYLSEGCYVAEWSNTPEDPAVSIARARVPRGVTTRWHRLSGIAERYVILEGTGRAYVLAICTPRFTYDAYEELEC